MKKQTTEHTQTFEIEELGEVLVNYRKTVTKYPERVEEFHGTHVFSEDEVEIDIYSVELCVGKQVIELFLGLEQKTFDLIKDKIKID